VFLKKLDLRKDYSNLILVGDIIDRGPKSRNMINFVRKYNIKMVQGNHEKMMCEAFKDKLEWHDSLDMSNWANNGGDQMLLEYRKYNGNIDIKSLDYDYKFLLNLPIFYIDDNLSDDKGRKLLVTHAAAGDIIEDYINTLNKLNDGQVYKDTLQMKYHISNYKMLIQWDRSVPKKIQEKYFNVFGHTPISHYYSKKGLENCLTSNGVVFDKKKGFANIDTGCVFKDTDKSGMLGKMTAIEFPSLNIIQQENLDIVK